MKFIEYTEKLDTIIYMAEHRRTGSLRELASRLDVSERTIIRMIQLLRGQGYPIAYDRFRSSYVINEQMERNVY